jgi:hypothetical protein
VQHHGAAGSNSQGNTAAAAAAAGGANAAAAAAGGLAQLSQLPPELLNALGLAGQLGGAAAPAAAAAALPSLFPGSWPLHLAGLLRPPPVQTTNILQLAMMMQSAAQANALQGGSGDTQQAAMVVAALQGLAANMRMLMPWTNNQAPWQPRPAAVQQQQQQELLNGSCLASGQVLPWQLSSSYGAGGQKATLQFGSQPQTSTTDISGQGALPGGHSHSTVVAAAAAAAAAAAGAPMAGLTGPAGALLSSMAGLHRLDSSERPDLAMHQQRQQHKQKQKRKPRQFDNRVRYEGRKIRANNRVRVKGRFVKMGPNGETRCFLSFCCATAALPCCRCLL